MNTIYDHLSGTCIWILPCWQIGQSLDRMVSPLSSRQCCTREHPIGQVSSSQRTKEGNPGIEFVRCALLHIDERPNPFRPMPVRYIEMPVDP
ncbi:uncharacterized protein METZ01_LOCUS139505 [marine metagenome]|uniref:Uncharacterized protein n=1 Tax=marine metagenome TaxID=408172 RepID=A0A381ZCH4_9ZZZZ